MLGDPRLRSLRSRIASVTTMNTPHYGTPLASFFATVSGQRLLYVLSALTVTALKFGAPPLAITSSLVATLGRIDRVFGMEVKLLDGLTETIVRALDDATSRDLRSYLAGLRDDQGGIIQLSPESMDLFALSVEDNPDVVYQSTASYAPAPGVRHWARSLASPWTSPSATIFTTLYQLTAMQHRMYPCEPTNTDWNRVLIDRLGQVPPPLANDGIVPFRSQLWGKLIWAGPGRPPRRGGPLRRKSTQRRARRLAELGGALRPGSVRRVARRHRPRDGRRAPSLGRYSSGRLPGLQSAILSVRVSRKRASW